MARISENSPRYRKTEVLIEDLKKVLNLDIHYGTKYAVLFEILWIWTEFDGKYLGNPYWSETALKTYFDRKNVTDFTYGKFLRHDHAVPRKIILDHLLDTKEINEEYIRNVFEKALVGVILTKSEDADILKDKMPPPVDTKSIKDYSDTDKWARYKDLGIKIYQVKWEGKRIKTICGDPFSNIVDFK